MTEHKKGMLSIAGRTVTNRHLPCSNLMHPHIQIKSRKIHGKEDCHEKVTTGQQADG